MERQEILQWLREESNAALETLWSRADETRRCAVGDEVYLRGLIEFSNFCINNCAYCGLRVDNRTNRRYRMPEEEILDAAQKAASLGYGTIVLQSGNDPYNTDAWVAELVRKIKRTANIAVTLSLGEQAFETLALWREAGADRYLLRFETSDVRLFRRIHPSNCGEGHIRITLLQWLAELGYEIGGGMMVGLPGQSYESLAADLEICAQLDLDMIGIGPYIAHRETPLGRQAANYVLPPDQQVPNTETMACKALALARLMRPDANIPATTALATADKANGLAHGLTRGANIVMPNVTPIHYRRHYVIYPDRYSEVMDPDSHYRYVVDALSALGRPIGKGPGASPALARKGNGFKAADGGPGGDV